MTTTSTTTLLTKSETVSLLAAHLAFEDRGGDRADEWQAGHEEFRFPCMSLRLSMLRHAEQGTEPRKAKFNHLAGDWDQREYALPCGGSPQDVVVESLEYDSSRDLHNAEASDVTERLLDMIENA